MYHEHRFAATRLWCAFARAGVAQAFLPAVSPTFQSAGRESGPRARRQNVWTRGSTAGIPTLNFRSEISNLKFKDPPEFRLTWHPWWPIINSIERAYENRESQEAMDKAPNHHGSPLL